MKAVILNKNDIKTIILLGSSIKKRYKYKFWKKTKELIITKASIKVYTKYNLDVNASKLFWNLEYSCDEIAKKKFDELLKYINDEKNLFINLNLFVE